MAFGLLTTKWRIFRRKLNYHNENNAKIIRVATKLHNYCIRMAQLDGVRPGQDELANLVESLEGDSNGLGYTPTYASDDDGAQPSPGARYPTLLPDASRRNSLLATVRARVLQRPEHNLQRN